MLAALVRLLESSLQPLRLGGQRGKVLIQRTHQSLGLLVGHLARRRNDAYHHLQNGLFDGQPLREDGLQLDACIGVTQIACGQLDAEFLGDDCKNIK